jgi:hypothetical protein
MLIQGCEIVIQLIISGLQAIWKFEKSNLDRFVGAAGPQLVQLQSRPLEPGGFYQWLI